MNTLEAKVLCMILLGLLTIVFGLTPLLVNYRYVRNKKRQPTSQRSSTFCSVSGQSLLSALACFGGGVILTTSLTHMLPEVSLSLNQNIKEGLFPQINLPMAEIIVLCGFFMIYLLEAVTHAVLDKFQTTKRIHHHHHHLHNEKDHHLHLATDEEKPMCNTEQDSINISDRSYSPAPLEPEAGSNAQILDHSQSYCQAAMRGFMVVLALSLHGLFEGIALGVTPNYSSVWFVFFAISTHKYVIAFVIGMQFVHSGLKPCLIVLYMSAFAVVSPLGSGIGILLSEMQQTESALQSSTVTVLQGLATGTLLYVVFFEVIEKERLKGTSSLLQVAFLMLGFFSMILLEVIPFQGSDESGSHGHSHGHSHDDAVQEAHTDHVVQCLLSSFSSTWKLPMNFSCSNGVLQPSDQHLNL